MKEKFTIQEKQLQVSSEDVIEAFNKTTPEHWKNRSGHEPWYMVVVSGNKKPVKAVFRNLKPVIDKSLNEFTTDDAERVFKKLGFEVVKEKGEAEMNKNSRDITIAGTSGDDQSITDAFNRHREDGRIEFITFHPSYSYEEFIEGITVETKGEGIPCEHPRYLLKAGIFKNFCKNALGAVLGATAEEVNKKTWRDVFEEYNKQKPVDFSEAPKYVLIIDEINRGDIAKIFGELITLLESDKRIGESNELIVKLPASNDYFGVPPNVYVVATMNTADRSIALLDIALRRRFGFVEMNPDFDVLMAEHITRNKDKFENGVYEILVKSVEAVKKINQKICSDKTIGRDRQIGHSFFFKVFTNSDLLLVWRHEILPLLEEYCYSDYRKINRLIFGLDSDTKWISESEGIRDISNLDEMLEAIR